MHYELEVKANGYDWMVHTTKYVEVGSHVGIKVIPFNNPGKCTSLSPQMKRRWR